MPCVTFTEDLQNFGLSTMEILETSVSKCRI